MNDASITKTDKKYQKYSTPIGLIVIVVWGCILVGMMLQKINDFTNQYTTNTYSSENR